MQSHFFNDVVIRHCLGSHKTLWIDVVIRYCEFQIYGRYWIMDFESACAFKPDLENVP
jgi:hypothetical protein